MKRFSLLTILSILLLTVQAQGRPRITAELDSTIMTMGSTASLSVEVHVPAQAEPQFIGFPPAIDQNTGFVQFGPVQVVAADSSSTVDSERSYKFNYTIQAFDPGMWTLPAFGVLMPGSRDTVLSEVLALKVLPVEVDTVTMALMPSAPPSSIPMKWHDWIPIWLIIVLGALAVAALVIFLVMKFRKHKEEVKIRKSKPIPPYDLAKMRLETLRSRKLASSGHEKEFYTELTDILRQYLQGRFGINAMEMTSGQILRALHKNPLTRLPAAQMDEVLKIADFVKFAKERPLAEDNERALIRSTQFVDETKPVPPPPEPEKAPASKAKKKKN